METFSADVEDETILSTIFKDSFPGSNDLFIIYAPFGVFSLFYCVIYLWTDKISNEEVIQRIREKEVCLYNSVQKQKMAFACHVLRGSSGKDLLDVLEGKLNSKLSQGRPRRM